MNTRFEIAEAVVKKIREAEDFKAERKYSIKYSIAAVCEELSIFDWWNEFLSVSQLKQMQNFLKVAERLGYNGYVCFKVGAKGCSHGMWAYKKESTDGYSPDGECLWHSFRSGDNDWDVRLADGDWLHDKYEKDSFTLKEVEKELA